MVHSQISNPQNATEIVQLFISLASIIYICLHISQSHTQPIITFVITLFVLHFLLKLPHYISFFSALLVSYLCFDVYYIPQIESFITRKNGKFGPGRHEHFSNDDDDDDSKPTFDLTSTVADALKNLTPTQIESMAKETKDLVHSQKQLVDTLSQLAPVVENGMKLMQSFGGGAKSGNVSDMFQQIKNKEKMTLSPIPAQAPAPPVSNQTTTTHQESLFS
jgi:hypothetical protein